MCCRKPSVEDRAAIDEAIARGIEILPLCVAGDLQGAMQKLHSVDKEKKEKLVEKAEPKVAAKPAVKREQKPEAESRNETRAETGNQA
jgi:hypothetical protein